jgi:hypothetical protein
VQVAECWTGPPHFDPDNLEETSRKYAAMGYTFENYPQRREIVFFMADDGREFLTAEREIIRPAHGRAYLGKLSAIERPDRLVGKFVGLLPSAGVQS